jgi:hypothetical protein
MNLGQISLLRNVYPVISLAVVSRPGTLFLERKRLLTRRGSGVGWTVCIMFNQDQLPFDERTGSSKATNYGSLIKVNRTKLKVIFFVFERCIHKSMYPLLHFDYCRQKNSNSEVNRTW